MKRNQSIFIVFGLMLAVIFLITCDRDCPSCPEQNSGEHLFYVYCQGDTPQIKAFSVEQGLFIDSIFVPDMDIKVMHVVGRDKYLFLGGLNSIRVIDLKTKEAVYNADGFRGIGAISPDGNYYTTRSLTPWEHQLHRFSDKKLILADSEVTASGRFSADSKYYYYGRDTNVIRIYDIAGDSMIQSTPLTLNDNPIHLFDLWQTPDGAKYIIHFYYNYRLYLGAVDNGENSVRVLGDVTRTGGFDGAMSPDGKYFYYVNPAYTFYELPGDTVYIYDVESEQLAATISTFDDHFEPNHLALSHDGSYLALTPYAMGSSHSMEILLYYVPGLSKMGFFSMGGSFTDARIPELVCTRQPGSN